MTLLQDPVRCGGGAFGGWARTRWLRSAPRLALMGAERTLSPSAAVLVQLAILFRLGDLLAFSIHGLVSAMLFRRGRWKAKLD